MSAEQIIGREPLEVKSSDNIMQDHIDELKVQLEHRDNLIAKLQDQLRGISQDQRTSVNEVSLSTLCALLFEFDLGRSITPGNVPPQPDLFFKESYFGDPHCFFSIHGRHGTINIKRKISKLYLGVGYTGVKKGDVSNCLGLPHI